jgi:hypothetical protein
LRSVTGGQGDPPPQISFRIRLHRSVGVCGTEHRQFLFGQGGARTGGADCSRCRDVGGAAAVAGQGEFGVALDGALRDRGFALVPFPNADAVPLRYRLWSNSAETGVSIQVGHLVAARVYPNGGAAGSGAWSIREDG